MSRLFVAASSQYLTYAGVILTDYPFTVSYWAKVTALSAQTHFYVGDQTGNTDYFWLGIDASGFPNIAARNSSVSRQTPHNVAVTTGTWVNIIGVWASATDRRVYLNNDAGTQDTTSCVAGAGFDVTTIGRLDRASINFYTDARLAHMGVWTSALDATSRASLAAGQPPSAVGAPIDYWKLTDNVSPETDSGSAPQSMTVVGATYSADDPFGVPRSPAPRTGGQKPAVARAATR